VSLWCIRTAVAALCFLLFAEPAPAQEFNSEQKIALVIGNARYPGAPLRNPVNDARAMADKLERLGFQVTLLENADNRDMARAVGAFGATITRGGVGLFYYAGHGLQVRGRNFLVPIDARIESEASVLVEAIEADSVLEQMAAAGNRLNIVILDACRNNPFERRFRGSSAGLAQTEAPTGSLIAYATAPGKVASDGDDANGLYTGELLRVLEEPGLKVEDVFKRVRARVAAATNNQQVPWEASSLTGDFYFGARAPQASTSQASATEQHKTTEVIFWESIQGSTNPADYRAYLEAFPNGVFAPLARVRAQTGGVDAPAQMSNTGPDPEEEADAMIAAVPPASGTLSGDQIRTILAGNSMTCTCADGRRHYTNFYMPNGTLKQIFEGQKSGGRWSVADDMLCHDWYGTDSDDGCWTIVLDGDRVHLLDEDGEEVTVGRLLPGNPDEL
jgi:Caspase domain